LKNSKESLKNSRRELELLYTLIEERAAILEYDEHLTREMAEMLAKIEYLTKPEKKAIVTKI
jgi:hypothetical protein